LKVVKADAIHVTAPIEPENGVGFETGISRSPYMEGDAPHLSADTQCVICCESGDLSGSKGFEVAAKLVAGNEA